MAQKKFPPERLNKSRRTRDLTEPTPEFKKNMKQVKVFIEKSSFGYSAYMEEANLDYGLFGEGKTVAEAIDDFNKSYAGMREYYGRHGKVFEEIDYEFFYDTASFLQEYCKAFSLAGLERITGVSQTQLGHYLHGRSKPTRKTIDKIQKGVQKFAQELTAVRFA
jgi:hypothetical protein